MVVANFTNSFMGFQKLQRKNKKYSQKGALIKPQGVERWTNEPKTICKCLLEQHGNRMFCF